MEYERLHTKHVRVTFACANAESYDSEKPSWVTLSGAEVTRHEPPQLSSAEMAEMWNVHEIERQPQDFSGLPCSYEPINTVNVVPKAGSEGC